MWRRFTALAAAPLLVLVSVFGAGIPVARAAGSAQVLVSVVAVDATTGVPITTLSATQSPRRIAFRVDFSCVTANCDNATVKFDPTALDPNYNFYRLLGQQTGFTPPLTGGSIAGSPATGYTVSLGNLTAGASGQFTVEYAWAAAGGVVAGGAGGERVDTAVQNVPDGFPITATVTGNADTASNTTTATSAPVTWHIDTPTPAIATNLAAPSSGFFATDTNISYALATSTGCGGVDRQCASGYTVTHQLPPGAELVSAPGNPTVTGSVASGLILTWAGPAWAATGATSQGGWNPSRTITITFPRANVAPPGQPCNFTTQFSGPSGSATATYISMPGAPGAVKTATLAPGGPFQLKCADPFPRAQAIGKDSTADGAELEGNTVSPVAIPVAGGVNNKQWLVTVANTANIAGVAVVTDDQLDQPDLPVYQIVATTGATIAWTATDGTTTQSGTSTSIANAPTGFRFVTSTVTSPSLPAPNQLMEQTNSTNFTVHYLYRVTSDATPGARRTNTASAVMQWPDNPEFAGTPLTIPPHTVELEPPFARSVTFKYADTFLTNPIGSARIMGQNIDVPVPAAGESDRILRWNAVVANTGSAPAVPTVVDTHLGDNPDMPITQIIAGVRSGSPPPAIASGTLTQNVPFTATYTLDNGTTGTYTGTGFTAPAGRRIMSATVTGPTLNGANVLPATNASQQLEVYFQGLIPVSAARDTYTTNTFDGSLDYGVSGLGTLTGTGTSTVHLVGLPPTITATLGTPVLAGGATRATPTTDVTFTVGGSTSNVASDRDITPQYVFMAPAGWNITPGSASFPAGSVPAGVSFQYRSVTVAGMDRQVVVASWPAGTVFGKNKTLPVMSVIVRPSASAPAGSVGVPRGFIGNTNTVLPGDVFTQPFTDAPDLDDDANTTELFSEAPAPTGVTVGSVGAMQVLKEICLPDASAADGCDWFADPASHVGVPPNSTSIKYRLTVTNTGNTTLSDVVGYDVLPYLGDTGTSDATATAPRGSTMRESIASTTTPTGGATVTFSTATQPCRPEVNPSVPGCVNDWGPTAAGAQSLRVDKSGDLAPGESFSLEYTAAVNDSPGFGAVGCNSFAVKATGLATVSEPAPVCASIEETDLQITAGTPQLQDGRPGVLPWTVINNGGAPSTIGEVVLHDIPAGLEVTSFTPDGWTCTATDAHGNPVYGTAVGPATLSCTSNAPLLLGVPVPLNIPVRPTTTAGLTIPADVSGRMFDPNLANNNDQMQVNALAAAGDIGVTKDDGRTTASPGDQVTYTVTVTNPLDFETLTGATLTDTLPAGVAFVSASDGGTAAGAVVTWALPDLTGAASLTRTVTVTVLSTIAAAQLDNAAHVAAPDPANPDATLTGTADDVDTVLTHPAITLAKGSTESTYAAVGDTIHYTFSATNTGDVTLTKVTITDPMPGLSAITYAWPSTTGVLTPGETVTATATYVITQADLDAGTVDNTATATGTPPSGDPVGADDNHTVTSTATPHVNLTKTASVAQAHQAGDVVNYTFVVVNDGPITLQSVTITDPLPGLSTITYTWPGAPGTLAPGQQATATASHTVTQADADAGQVSNTAAVTGLTPLGVPVIDDDSALVTIPAAPAISLVKHGAYAPGETGHAGDKLLYSFTAKNTGNVTLTGVTISDPLPGLSNIVYTWPGTPGVLAPGQVVTATADHTVTQADVDRLAGVSNTATATGAPPSGDPVTDQDTVHLDLPATTGIQVVKTGVLHNGAPTDQAPVRAGDVVDYQFAVTNLGDLTLHDVMLTDPMPGLSSITYAWPGTEGVLAPGQVLTATASYTLTQTDIDTGYVANTATATGVSPADDTVTDDDTATVVLPPAPGIALVKTPTFQPGHAPVKPGEVIHYNFEITNTGNVTETAVMITDPMLGLSNITYTWPGADGVLAPGEKATATASYTIAQTDIDTGQVANTATATGLTPGKQTVSDDDTATVELSAARGLALKKSATYKGAAVWSTGDLVVYSFEITNTGNVTETGVTIADPMPGLSAITYTWPGEEGVLAPGQRASATASYGLTRQDVDRGKLSNTATVRSTHGTSAKDTATLTAPPKPPADPTGPAPTSSAGSGLASTGIDTQLQLILAGLLLGIGGLLTLTGIRHRNRTS